MTTTSTQPTLSAAPVDTADLDEVAELAAAEHARDRRADDLLGPVTGDPASVRPLLDGLEGTVVRRDGAVVAGWLGRPGGGAQAAPVFGLVGDPAALREAYAVQAGTWFAAGHRTHTAVVRAADRARHDALVDLGFGHEQAYAVLDLAVPDAGRVAVPSGVDVRPGSLDDLAEIVPLAPVIGRHQVASPVFARVGAEFFDQLEESHREELADPEAHYLVARVDGTAVGFAIWYDGIDGPFMASSYAELSVAAVPEQTRGRGVGLALTAAVIDAARAQGVTRLAADWRTTNLLSSRFWPARGFQVVGWRMSRTIDTDPA
jgi:ribosomal protein S18 acetylase RimI-like enzyme